MQPDLEAPSTAPNPPQRQPVATRGTNANGQIYGTSNYMKADTYGNEVLAEAELKDFAPAPTPCVCCGCFVNDKMRKRTYYRVYENRFEYNAIVAPCLCLSKERCIGDYTRVHYFDQQPSRSANFCGCIPCICCGPPVVFYQKIYITESLINLTRAKRIAGNGCHGHVHLSFESQEFEPVGGIL